MINIRKEHPTPEAPSKIIKQTTNLFGTEICDDLISHTLCFLPAPELGNIDLLSKQWRSLTKVAWKELNNKQQVFGWRDASKVDNQQKIKYAETRLFELILHLNYHERIDNFNNRALQSDEIYKHIETSKDTSLHFCPMFKLAIKHLKGEIGYDDYQRYTEVKDSEKMTFSGDYLLQLFLKMRQLSKISTELHLKNQCEFDIREDIDKALDKKITFVADLFASYIGIREYDPKNFILRAAELGNIKPFEKMISARTIIAYEKQLTKYPTIDVLALATIAFKDLAKEQVDIKFRNECYEKSLYYFEQNIQNHGEKVPSYVYFVAVKVYLSYQNIIPDNQIKASFLKKALEQLEMGVKAIKKGDLNSWDSFNSWVNKTFKISERLLEAPLYNKDTVPCIKKAIDLTLQLGNLYRNLNDLGKYQPYLSECGFYYSNLSDMLSMLSKYTEDEKEQSDLMTQSERYKQVAYHVNIIDKSESILRTYKDIL